MKRTGDARLEIVRGAELGTRAVWGRVGYAGREFAPFPGTYGTRGPDAMDFTTLEDSGMCSAERVPVANLMPLVAAALYETGFAWEAGPLSTWSN